MALTDTQKLSLKKHLGVTPIDTILDPFIAQVEAEGTAFETELTDAISTCDDALDAIRTVQTSADELTEGAGAKFDYNRSIAIKRRQYEEEVGNLARIMGYPSPYNGPGIIMGGMV